jgi:hypothetical protein
MGTILTYNNPRKGGTNKKGAKMAKAKKADKPKKRRTGKKNGTLSIVQALHAQPAMLGGMYAAKFGANKLSQNGGDDVEWDMKAYLGAGLGAYVGGMIANAIKKGSGQKVMNAGIAYVAFKAVRNELISRSEFATAQLGDDVEDLLHPDYQGDGDILYGEDEETYIMTEDGWRTADESDRLMGAAEDERYPTVVPATARLGEAPDERYPTVVPATARLGGADDVYRKAFFGDADPYKAAFFG